MSPNTSLPIPFFKPHLGRKELCAIKRVIHSDWLTTGPEALAFEKEFAAFLGRDGADSWALAVNSATAGLHLALEALGIGAGDRVAVPTMTFSATAASIRYLGAEPVFIDSLPNSGNISPEGLYKERKNIKAVILVHLAGNPCRLEDIRNALPNSVIIIEDAAHAFPSRGSEGMAGTLGDIGVFSFYATKTITTGEGGMIVGRNPEIHERIRVTRLHGINRAIWNRYSTQAEARSWEYDVIKLGFKYNLPDLAAAIGRIQLAKADKLLAMRTEQARRYSQGLADLPGLCLPENNMGHAWHLYILKLESMELRDRLNQRLYNEGIGTSVHFIPLHRMSYWKKTLNLSSNDFPMAESLADRILSIPLWPGLKRKDQDRIISIIRQELHG